MKKTGAALLLGALMMGAMQADAATVQVEFNDEQYDVTTITGTFDALSATLQSQIWWGNAAAASTFASAVGTQLGAPAENVGLTFSNWGPLFARSVSGTQVSSIALDVAGVFGFTIQGPTSSTTGTHTYAVASAQVAVVPLPATVWMLLAALGTLLGLKRLRSA